MKGEIAKLKEEHTHNTQLLNIKYEIKEKCLKDKIQQLVTKLSQTSKDFKNELKLNDEIINRYCKHNDNLKKQVVLCKNVIKNPKMMAHSIRKYNFDELQVYQYGEIKKSQSRKDWRKSFDRELKSITDSELTSYENFVTNDKERAKTRDISQRKNRKQLKNIITKIARSNSGSKSSLGMVDNWKYTSPTFTRSQRKKSYDRRSLLQKSKLMHQFKHVQNDSTTARMTPC